MDVFADSFESGSESLAQAHFALVQMLEASRFALVQFSLRLQHSLARAQLVALVLKRKYVTFDRKLKAWNVMLWLRMHTYEHLFLGEFEFRSNLVLVQISQLVDSLALLHLTVQVRVHFLQLPVEFELRLRSDVVTQALHVIRVANTSVQSGDVLNGMETFQLEEFTLC